MFISSSLSKQLFLKRAIHTIARSPSQAVKSSGEAPVLVYDSPQFKRNV